MKHGGRLSGMFDHFTAAALYDVIKEHFLQIRWPFWVAFILSGIVAFLLAIQRRGFRQVSSSPSALGSLVDTGQQLKVYFGSGVYDVPLRVCQVRTPLIPAKLQIRSLTRQYLPVLPLEVEVGGQSGIVLFSHKRDAAYAVSSEHPHPGPINTIHGGRYYIELEVGNGVTETWVLEVGPGYAPSLSPNHTVETNHNF